MAASARLSQIVKSGADVPIQVRDLPPGQNMSGALDAREVFHATNPRVMRPKQQKKAVN